MGREEEGREGVGREERKEEKERRGDEGGSGEGGRNEVFCGNYYNQIHSPPSDHILLKELLNNIGDVGDIDLVGENSTVVHTVTITVSQ